jgi:hypothetical protein
VWHWMSVIGSKKKNTHTHKPLEFVATRDAVRFKHIFIMKLKIHGPGHQRTRFIEDGSLLWHSIFLTWMWSSSGDRYEQVVGQFSKWFVRVSILRGILRGCDWFR